MNFVRLLKINHRVFHLEIVSLIFFFHFGFKRCLLSSSFFYSTEGSFPTASLIQDGPRDGRRR